jgi:hypothetical protein
MSESSFKKHLQDLEEVLKELLGDIESGPDDKVQQWYDETLDVIYVYEDEVDSNIYMRLGLDEDSIEDGEILEDSDEFEFEETEITQEDIDEDYEDDEDADTEDADETAENEQDTIQSDDKEGLKTININVYFPKSE